MKRSFALLALLAATAAPFLGGCAPSNSASAGSAGQSSSPTQGNGASGQTAPGNSAPQNRGAGMQGRGPATFGPVASFDGGVLTITTQQGDTKVNVGSARIEKTVEGAVSDLQAGTSVIVTGQQNADGSFTAGSIQIMPANAAGQGGFQGQRQRQNQGQESGQQQGQGQGPSPRQNGNQGQNQGQGMRGLFGSVVSVSGNTLTLKDGQGNTSQVDISGARVQKTVDGTVDDLKAGETVSVTGQQGSDGTISATNIQIRPAGAFSGRPARSGAPQANPNATPTGN